MMQKLMINQAYENMGVNHTQMLATFFDGIARHTPEGINFKKRAQTEGWKKSCKRKRSGNLRLDK